MRQFNLVWKNFSMGSMFRNCVRSGCLEQPFFVHIMESLNHNTARTAAPALYLGTTPDDLRTARQVAKSVLEQMGYAVVDGNDITAVSGPSLDRDMWECISRCAGMVHLVGTSFGSGAPGAAPGTNRMSIAQLEQRLAQTAGVPSYVYLLDEDFPSDEAGMETPDAQALQYRVRSQITAQSSGWERIETSERLRQRMRLITFRLEEVRSRVRPEFVQAPAAPEPLPQPASSPVEARPMPPLPARSPAFSATPAPTRRTSHLAMALACLGIVAIASALGITVWRNASLHSSETPKLTAEAQTTSSTTAEHPAPVPSAPKGEAAAGHAATTSLSDSLAPTAPPPGGVALGPLPAKPFESPHTATLMGLSGEASRFCQVGMKWPRKIDRAVKAHAGKLRVTEDYILDITDEVKLWGSDPMPIKQAFHAMVTGNDKVVVQECVKTVDLALKQHVQDPQLLRLAWMLRGDAEMRLMDYRSAVASYRQSLAYVDKEKHGFAWTEGAARLGHAYHYAGNWADAETLLRECLARREEMGPNDPSLTHVLADLAWVLTGQNKWMEAEPLFRRALAIDEKYFGPENPRTVSRLLDLAEFLDPATHPKEIESLLRRALSLEEKIWGRDDVMLAAVMGKLSGALQGPQEGKEAEELARRAVKLCEQASSKGDNLLTTAALFRLGWALFFLKRTDEAAAIAQRVEDVLENHSFLDEPSLEKAWQWEQAIALACVSNSGTPSAEQGQRAKDALALRIQSLGANHPTVADSLVITASANPSERIALYQRIVESRLKSFGPDHPLVLGDLAQLLQSMSAAKWPEGEMEPFIAQAMANADKRGPKDPIAAAIALLRIAEMLKNGGHQRNATVLCEKAAIICQARLGADSPITKGAMAKLKSYQERNGSIANSAVTSAQPDKSALRTLPKATPPSVPTARSTAASGTPPASLEKNDPRALLSAIVTAVTTTYEPGEPMSADARMIQAVQDLGASHGPTFRDDWAAMIEFARQAPRNPKATQLIKAQLLFVLKDYEKAQAVASDILNRKSGTAEELRQAALLKGTALRQMGDTVGALEAYRHLLSLAEKVRATEPVVWCDAALPLAIAMSDTSSWREAVTLLSDVDATLEKALGPGNAKSAHASRLLVFAARRVAESEGRTDGIDDLEKTARYVLSVDERLFGPEHAAVARDLTELAAVLLLNRDSYDEAEKLLRRAIEIRKRNHADGDPGHVTTLVVLGKVLGKKKRLHEAITVFDQALAIREKDLGLEHHGLIRVLQEYSLLLNQHQQYAQVVPLVRRTLQLFEQNLGKDHPLVAQELTALGNALYLAREMKEAEEVTLRALALREKLHGKVHAKVAVAQNNLAQLLRNTDRREEAESWFLKAMRTAEQSPQGDASLPAFNLGTMLFEDKRANEAEPLLRKAIELTRKNHGENAPDLIKRLYALAWVVKQRGDLDEPITLSREALALEVKLHGEKAESTIVSRAALGALLAEAGKNEEAEKVMRQALADLAALSRRQGMEHEELSTYRKVYTMILQRNGLSDAAVEKRMQEVEDGAKVTGQR
jgi:tetratricopeptide (TPR) repeat protein